MKAPPLQRAPDAGVFAVVDDGGNLLAVALSVAPSAVSCFDHNAVDAAVAKGAILFGASDKYIVHSSRREKPGIPEIHTPDADIVYVLEGTATIVTDYEAVNVEVTATDEFRGNSIRNGNERSLAKGDVIVIPAGTPRWFKGVSNPLRR